MALLCKWREKSISIGNWRGLFPVCFAELCSGLKEIQ